MRVHQSTWPQEAHGVVKKVMKTSALKYFYSVRTDRCRKYNEHTKEHSTGDTKDGPDGRFNLTLM